MINEPINADFEESDRSIGQSRAYAKINNADENDPAEAYLLSAKQRRYLVFKRVCDIVISFAALIVLILPLAIISLIQKILAPKEPVFFVQTRIGKNGVPFKLIKFRSMKSTAPHSCPTKAFEDGEQYITGFGRFLRITSIDELPQFLQVFLGKMSLIGPRPLIPEESIVHEMRKRVGVYQIRPGLTGWAQVNGRDFVEDKEKVAFDLQYIEKLSLKIDVKIFWMTVKKVLTKADINEGAMPGKSKRRK